MSVTIGKLKISSLFLLIFIFLYFIDKSPHVPMLLASIVIHEAGHIFAIKMCGGKILWIEVLLNGVDIRTDGTLTSYRQDIFIFLAGAAFNFLVAVSSLIYMRMTAYSTEILFFLLTNLAYAVINLFPIANLDGGKAVSRLLEATLPPDKAYYMNNAISIGSLIVLSMASIFILVVTQYNFSLALICVCLFFAVYSKRQPKI